MSHFRTLTEISYELAHRLPPLYAREPIFFLAQTDKEARQLFSLTRYWNNSFPADSIISPVWLEQHRLTTKQFIQRTITLGRGVDLSISQLVDRLVQLGFDRYPRVVAPRSFAVRGNIVDVIDRRPARLEYNGNTIESLHLFDPVTQTRGQKLDQCLLWPRAYAEHLPVWKEYDLTYEYITPKFYHKRFALLKRDAERYLHIQVATALPAEVHTLLPTAKLTAGLPGLDGFILPVEHKLFLTDEHIFGQAEQLATFPTELDWTAVEPGDYVVHIDHGIGLFHGLTTITNDRYFELHYQGNDKLFVPFDKANRIEKYIGQAKPKLSRLSGTQWETVVHKVQEDIRQTARELLELHAQRAIATATAIPPASTNEERLIAEDIDFTLTADQTQSIQDIIDDLHDEQPMDRLLCGDVGFGKTEVALRVAAHVVMQGGQVALLAPTTVLAQQHFETFTERCSSYGITVGLLSRLQTTTQQRQTVQLLQQQQIDIVIGTHRLLSSDVVAPALQLVIIDEEQRFGVVHKERLTMLRHSAHVLTLTATPIPRTLNLALSGLHDISVLNTAPPLRLGIKTLITEFKPALELQAVSDELERHGQVYVVHNNLETIETRRSFLQQHFPRATVTVAHGQMAATDLVHIMTAFHTGKIDILVASTIIENGLDIANANTLIVERAEQFGLAQLYQLRGRIGRGQHRAYAYLLYSPSELTRSGRERLRALQQVKELGGGFELAMKDLEIRGVGDILGKKQHGHVQQIGLNLYSRLLQQAIVQLQRNDQPG